MKLPEIDYTAPVPSESQGFARLDAAQERAASTFEEGLSAYGQEQVRAQHDKASSQLLSGLDQAQIDLRENRTISTQELKDQLGSAYGKLPPEVLEQATRPDPDAMTDTGTGAGIASMGRVDRNDIPMHAVAGYIFDARAKKLLADSASHLTSDGWRASFVENAQNEITRNKLSLSKVMLHQMHEDLQAKDMQSAVDYMNAGRFDLARGVLNASRTLDPKVKAELASHIDKGEQTRPLYDHLRTGNIAGMLQDQKMLDDPNQLGKLTPEERLAFTNRIEAEVSKFQREIKGADDARMKQAAEAGWNGIFDKERTGQPIDYKDIPAPGAIPAREQKEMIEYIDKLNKGEKPETDAATYAGLADLITKKPDQFKSTNLLRFRNRLNDSDLKHFIDIQVGLKGGNPEAYDHFQNTDKAVDIQLQAPEYGINFTDTKNKETQRQIGYVKTLVQNELADTQEANGGKPLSLAERDGTIARVLRDNIDPRRARLIGMSKAHILDYEAGIPPAMASAFQKSVMLLSPGIMNGIDSDAKINELKNRYTSYQAHEDYINRAYQKLAGKNVTPEMSVKVWDRVVNNRSRYEAVLKRDGGFDPKDADLNEERMTYLATYELLGGR